MKEPDLKKSALILMLIALFVLWSPSGFAKINIRPKANEIIFNFRDSLAALINDQYLGAFVVDTNSAYTTISPEFATTMGIEISDETPRQNVLTDRGWVKAPLVTLPIVTLNRIEVRNLEAVVVDTEDDFTRSGRIGMNYFKNLTLSIKKDRLIVYAPNLMQKQVSPMYLPSVNWKAGAWSSGDHSP